MYLFMFGKKCDALCRVMRIIKKFGTRVLRRTVVSNESCVFKKGFLQHCYRVYDGCFLEPDGYGIIHHHLIYNAKMSAVS